MEGSTPRHANQASRFRRPPLCLGEVLRPVRPMASCRTIALGLTAALLLASESPAATMRCGNALVQEGDYKVQVLLTCGEPLFVDRAYECLPGGLACDFVERWAYDPGPFRMLRIVTFRHGRVDRIEQVAHP